MINEPKYESPVIPINTNTPVKESPDAAAVRQAAEQLPKAGATLGQFGKLGGFNPRDTQIGGFGPDDLRPLGEVGKTIAETGRRILKDGVRINPDDIKIGGFDLPKEPSATEKFAGQASANKHIQPVIDALAKDAHDQRMKAPIPGFDGGKLDPTWMHDAASSGLASPLTNLAAAKPAQRGGRE